ncbi:MULTISPECIES: GntR family transcriptional regulator [unclassified Sphingomonas]|uniref:GntR family transcriptional regulator n=1 Tax=unclassified Sphingomonas TaxID=196159 RepID=UPI00070024B3|nr:MULTISPECIES: FCD domain-containing protein [unclassified Sphingomonas]KQX26293.1 GntR family transcriptional regulator [Sphingomonas sp. Root1294]KQY69363.1 GntR family transcriptional regulator [Sphingomonas sp. Root50]KRB89622.1 GntR family transcriptional regulator [Sphingomonas sp. Root720]
MTAKASFSSAAHWPGPEPAGSAQRVYLGILQDLEGGRMVPGQRLVETDLAARFEVGRNAVREAMQHLSVRGVVDLSPNRSPAIRSLDPAETLEVLDVAEAMTRLAARAAATGFRDEHGALLAAAIGELTEVASDGDAAAFSRARRGFYRALLLIGGNRELQRLFPAIGIHIIHAQYPSPRLRGIRLADYQAIARAVVARDAAAAERAAAEHVDNVRAVIRELMAIDL